LKEEMLAPLLGFDGAYGFPATNAAVPWHYPAWKRYFLWLRMEARLSNFTGDCRRIAQFARTAEPQADIFQMCQFRGLHPGFYGRHRSTHRNGGATSGRLGEFV